MAEGKYLEKNDLKAPGVNMGSKEKSKDFKETWLKLLKYCRKYWIVMVMAIISAIFGTILTLIGPDRLSELTDLITNGIMTGIDMTRIGKIGLTLVGFYVTSAFFSLFQGFVMATVTQWVTKNLRRDISRKINRLPISFYNHTSTGDILSRVTNDIDMIGQSLNQSVGTLVSSVTLLAGSLIMMLKTNLIMTFTAVLATVIGFALMLVIMSKSQKYFARQQKHLGEINGYVEEIYTGHTIVKAYNGEVKAKEAFTRQNNNLRNSGFKAQCLSGLMMPIMSFIGNFGYVAVCIIGAALAMSGDISFGVIVAFMMYIRYFTQPLSQLAQAAQSLQSAAAAGERVFEFLEAQEMADESHKVKRLSKAKGGVEFRHVHFGYDSNKIIINDFSARGEIRIDNIPTKDLRREDVHGQFCMVLQDTWLFEGTVRENLVYNTKNISNQIIEEACKAVGLDHFIRTLPYGYDTVLNDQVNLSQGQKQQLTIARAMIADKPMLILDEATSSVDTRTELQIQKAMDELMEGRTSFVIAHRLSTIKNADLILVMKDGDIIESGNHEDLLSRGGFYAELYNSQFDKAV